MKITEEQLALLGLIERNTGARALDVLENPASVVFLVQAGDAGKAIGKNGSNLRNLERALRRKVEIIEFASSLEGFVANLVKPASVEGITPSGENGLSVKVDGKNKGLAIGSKGWKINASRELLKRHYNVSEFKIM